MLWLLTMLLMLGMHLYETFTVLLLNSFLSGLPGGKEVSIILRNCLPTFVLTAEFHGGLNQVTLRLRDFPRLGMVGSWGGVNTKLWL